MVSLKEFRITLIVVFFGNLPAVSKFFFESLRMNSEVELLFFTDQKKQRHLPENIRWIKFSKSDFESRVLSKLDLKVRIRNPYKLCDFKPAYGHLFDDYLTSSTFWGYCDVDQVFGRIGKFLTAEVLLRNDIVTSRFNSLAGNFTIYRNNQKMMRLYQHANCWKPLLLDMDFYYAFDEKHKTGGINLESKFVSKVLHSLRKKKLSNCSRNDMNKIIQHEIDLKVYYGDCIASDEYFKNRKINNWLCQWKGGKIIEINSNREYMYFHFYRLKHFQQYSQSFGKPVGNIKCLSISNDQLSIEY